MVSFIWPGQFDYRMSRVIYDRSLSSNHFVSPNTLLSHIFFIFLVFCFSAFNILQALEKRWPSDSVRIMRQALETHYPLRLWDKLLSKLGTWGKNSRYRQLLDASTIDGAAHQKLWCKNVTHSTYRHYRLWCRSITESEIGETGFHFYGGGRNGCPFCLFLLYVRWIKKQIYDSFPLS